MCSWFERDFISGEVSGEMLTEENVMRLASFTERAPTSKDALQ